MVESLEHDTKGVVSTPRIADALRSVPRHEFVPEGHRAYLDKSFETDGSRVLAPTTVARLVEALDPKPSSSVLVVGAGVGYTAGVLAELTDPEQVHAVDISRQLVLAARSNLADAGYRDVLVDQGDGADGLPRYAPFDRILIEASVVELPSALRDQLTPDGRVVFPRGSVEQTLVAITAEEEEHFGPTSFDPLLVDGEETGAVERNRTKREDRERAREAAKSRGGWEHEWIDWDDQ